MAETDQITIRDQFIDQLRKNQRTQLSTDTTVVVDESSDPSAVGGLAALGATVVGATVLGRRIPALRNYFKSIVPKTSETINPTKSLKTVTDIGEVPTATGQSTELITTSRPLVPLRPKSRYVEVKDVPFTQGKGYSNKNPLVGSSAYDWIMEAPMETASAKEWVKWFKRGNQQHPVPTGALAGVSRRVNPEELRDLNIADIKGNDLVGGYLKFAEERNIPVTRDILLDMVRRSPLNDVKTLRLTARGNPEEELTRLTEDVIGLKGPITAATRSELNDWITTKTNLLDNLEDALEKSINLREINTTGEMQKKIALLATLDKANTPQYTNLLNKLNATMGPYNALKTQVKLPEGFAKFQSYRGDFSPTYKDRKTYHIAAGDNFTEDVFYYARRVPNTTDGKFAYVNGAPHYVSNEIGFVRYDDLPNPKLGFGKRHVRVSELQTDLHSPQFDREFKDIYFKKSKIPFNQDTAIRALSKEREELVSELEPFVKIGRGISGLTKEQIQRRDRLTYKLNQLDRSVVGAFITGQNKIDRTTAGPLARSFPDYALKNILRSMAQRGVNAISIVPSAMNKAIKMPNVNKIGDELNYGLMDGSSITKIKNPNNNQFTIAKSKDLATNVKILRNIAKQYGADFKMFPMPKSNPEKPFKVIARYDSRGGSSEAKGFDQLVRQGRAHYNQKFDAGGNSYYYYNDHIGAFETEAQAQRFLKNAKASQSFEESDRLYLDKMTPEDPRNYEEVPTLIASNDILKKFLLPMKAYMRVGGLVDKTNIFKSLI